MMTQPLPFLNSLQSAPQLYLKELLAQYGPPLQLFRIDPERNTLLVGAKGTRITIPPFSLASLSGKPVKGPVQIHLKEAFTQPEMILAGRPTTSEDRLMESGGQLMVYASQGLSPLKLARPMTIDVPVHKKLGNHLAMRLFVGGNSTLQAYAFNHNFDWGMASEKPVRIRKLEGRKYYHFQMQDFNWAGCDFFVARKASRCMVTARPVSAIEQFDSLLGYLVFQDIHAVARMYPGKHNCTAVNIPEKLSAAAHLVGISKGKLYYGNGIIRRASEKLVDVKMRPVMEKEMVEAIRRIK